MNKLISPCSLCFSPLLLAPLPALICDTRILLAPSAYAFFYKVRGIVTLIWTLICKRNEFIKKKKMADLQSFYAIISLFSTFQFGYPYTTYSYTVRLRVCVLVSASQYVVQ